MKTFIKNIKELVNVREEEFALPLRGEEMNELPIIEDAYLLIEDELIIDFGEMSELDIFEEGISQLDAIEASVERVIDAKGRVVFPSFCDSHTHLVYAGSREREFVDKIKGLSYKEIAERGGGILNSVKLLHDTPEEELYRQTLERAREIISLGTGAVEIKSGYGLSLEDEIKMLRVAKRIGEETPLTVKTTFLGAHAVPERYRGDRIGYVNEIINEMIPVIATEELAEYIDIFCEEGFFTVEDAERIFTAGMKYGLRPKVHANQMSFSGGVQVGVKYGALSVDHLEFTGREEFEALRDSDTIANLLPGATFFLGMDFPPAKEMIKYGLPLAVASNYNPGSSPSGSMQFMMALGALKMGLTPEIMVNAATINGAYAMGVEDILGSIEIGKKANLFITYPIPSYQFFLYSFSTSLVDMVILNGKQYK